MLGLSARNNLVVYASNVSVESYHVVWIQYYLIKILPMQIRCVYVRLVEELVIKRYLEIVVEIEK